MDSRLISQTMTIATKLFYFLTDSDFMEALFIGYLSYLSDSGKFFDYQFWKLRSICFFHYWLCFLSKRKAIYVFFLFSMRWLLPTPMSIYIKKKEPMQQENSSNFRMEKIFLVTRPTFLRGFTLKPYFAKLSRLKPFLTV